MHAHPNGTHLTTDLPTIAVPRDRAGHLLDELDDLIAVLNEALADHTTSRLVIADTESEQAIVEASLTLSVAGRNEAQRRALLALAIRDDAGHQALAATLREARARLFTAERLVAVTKQRIALVRAALDLR